MRHTKRITFFTIVLGLISNLGLVINAAPLILYEDSHFRGVRTEYILNGPGTCINIRGKLNDFFSSVQNSERSSCFLLCEHEYCRGRCVRVTKSIASLNLLDFNDMASSIQRCPLSTTTAAVVTPDSRSQSTTSTLVPATSTRTTRTTP